MVSTCVVSTLVYDFLFRMQPLILCVTGFYLHMSTVSARGFSIDEWPPPKQHTSKSWFCFSCFILFLQSHMRYWNSLKVKSKCFRATICRKLHIYWSAVLENWLPTRTSSLHTQCPSCLFCTTRTFQKPPSTTFIYLWALIELLVLHFYIL